MSGQKPALHPVAVAILLVGALTAWAAVIIAGMVWMPDAVPWLIAGPVLAILVLAQL